MKFLYPSSFKSSHSELLHKKHFEKNYITNREITEMKYFI